jgi:membrane protein YqaA with SNARE-associated domain
MTAKLMSQPFGIWIVGLVGVVLGGIAVFHIARGITGRFRKRLDLTAQKEKVRTVICRTCQFGLISRGITFLIVAWFFIRAAMHYEPGEAGGLREALGFVVSQTYGRWLLVILGLGMVAYGIYAFVEAKYRRIHV